MDNIWTGARTLLRLLKMSLEANLALDLYCCMAPATGIILQLLYFLIVQQTSADQLEHVLASPWGL